MHTAPPPAATVFCFRCFMVDAFPYWTKLKYCWSGCPHFDTVAALCEVLVLKKSVLCQFKYKQSWHALFFTLRALGRSSSRWRFCALFWALNFALLRSCFRAPWFFALFFCAPWFFALFFALLDFSAFFALLDFSRSYISAPYFRAHNFVLVRLYTARTGQPGQDTKNRTPKTGQPEQDRRNRTGWTGQAEQDRQSRTGRTGQAKQDRKNRTGRTGQPGQDSQ